MRNILVLSLSCLILHFSLITSFAYECDADLYDNKTMKDPKTDLSIYDKVFLKIVCKNLPEGENTFIVNWVNPHNKLFSSESHSFQVDSPDPRVAFFWLQLFPKSLLKRSWSGTDFQVENYGEWKVYVYSQGKIIVSKQFNMH